MHFRRFVICLVCVGAVSSGISGNAVAEPLWSRLLFRKGPEADPNKSYELTAEDGPWMIMAATFEGDGARQQAQDLVHELRADHKLEAYIHRVKFEFGKDLPHKQLERFDLPVKYHYRREGSEQFAVLVGNFQSVTDRRAQKTLRKVKTLRAKSLETSADKLTYQHFANWRSFTRRRGQDGQPGESGQMGNAFLAPNPLLPDDYFESEGMDPLVVKMNDSVRHSLFECPGHYTVQVATFRGRSVIEQSAIKAIESGEKRLRSSLEDAAEKANELTVALRAKGYEAYQFHDLHSSIVTVGSFNSVGTRQPDGKIQLHPTIQKIINTFGSQRTAAGGQAMVPASLLDITFDVKPLPVVVPRRPISRDYDRDQLSLLP